MLLLLFRVLWHDAVESVVIAAGTAFPREFIVAAVWSATADIICTIHIPSTSAVRVV